MLYPFQKIEKKWQNYWEKKKFYQAEDFSKNPKKYILVEFPYLSGEGLHVGHVRSYSALDAISRKKRMEGYNVLYPIGWDAFGLPTENSAIKQRINPNIIVQRNIKVFKKQLKSLGLSFDWSREINTTDPNYYKWTQWIFLQFFKRGLAYQAEMPINWCPQCKIGLANEEVISGRCERCGAETEKRNIKQWLLKITKYADRLLEDLDKVDYLEKIKIQQQNWIGRSEGTTIKFSNIEVFTTRADTIFGVTALVIAPEHPLVEKLTTKENKTKVKKYLEAAKKKSDLERTEAEKEKTGVFTGSYCLNPVNNEKIPVWVGDYVVATYGGGAVMVVPAHDKRDYQFAKRYGLGIRQVIYGSKLKEAFTDDGILINSGQFDGLTSKEARNRISNWLEKNKFGKKSVQYKLRDWIFSRQHYWGEPIPIIHCKKCGAVPVPEKELPVKLPYVKKYQPTQTGESPLAAITKWTKVVCPECGGTARRETDTMPNWAGSSWYFLRYIDPKNKRCFADFKKLKYWTPVDLYNGGMEHTTLHLLYSRFWHKFLYDLNLVPTPEPYAARRSHGMVLAEDGRKMSKSFGNVINPDEIVKKFGADTLRLYEMFMGPFDQAINWNNQGVVGVFRFLNRVWQLQTKIHPSRLRLSSAECPTLRIDKSIKKISEDLDNMKFNTAVSQLMILVNEFEKQGNLSREIYETFLKLLAPFAPHIAEELWQKLGHKKSIHLEKWPQYNPRLIQEEKFQLVIQLNGKVRDKIEVDADISEAEAKKLALSQEKIKKWLEEKEIKKTIFIPGRLINIVINDK
jgi:leucyl-tRNA synthetase